MKQNALALGTTATEYCGQNCTWLFLTL